MSFNPLKKAIQDRYTQLSKNSAVHFYKEVNREAVWDAYITGFPESERQEHQCNNCKSFIRQFAGLVFINADLVAESIWNISLNGIDEHYHNAIKQLRKYVNALPITDIFIPESHHLGTDKNLDMVRNVYWTHFSLVLRGGVDTMRPSDIPSKKGEIRTAKETFKRALDELTLDAADTVLELIAQNSLYKGKEFERTVSQFQIAKKKYDKVPLDLRDNYCWLNSQNNAVSAVRNSAIGTLLINLSEGMDLDTAVRKYEAVTAPATYKRPTALITPKMVESAKQTLTDLGLLDSLERRHANLTDVSINDILFADRSSDIKDVFDDLAKGALVNPKTLSKIEEVTIADFLDKVVPTAKGIELLLENKHLSNLISIVTAVNPDAKHMFKWDNPFSWSYTGGVADSIKERVKAAGGDVTGVLRFSIQWNDDDTQSILDFDAHAQEPGGDHIYYSSGFRKDKGNVRTKMTGQLDIDMTGRTGNSPIQVENITWSDINKMRDGVYKLWVYNFSGTPNKGFKAQVEANGEIYEFYHAKSAMGNIEVAEVTLSKGVFTVVPKFDAKSNVMSSTKWNVKSNVFTKVKNIMLSPNHWSGSIGHKHFIFILDGCVSDEPTRPFYNEHLKQELDVHRKVFEVMAGKLIVPFTENQLSGVGFSDTQPNSIIARVTGTFKRNIKIKI